MIDAGLEREAKEFKFGTYEHYKGGRYTAVSIVRHHGTGWPMVIYVSHGKGTVNARPLRGWHSAPPPETSDDDLLHDPDGWLDHVHTESYNGQRFRYIGE